ncbi:MAG: phycobiliprotein lyase [Cyanobacteria bacterium P01_A01_bin.135]
MDIQTFFEKSTGKWFCQCTSQHLGHSQSDWQRTDTWITPLDKGDSAALKLCEQFNIDPSLVIGGLSARWEGIQGADPDKKTGSSLLVAIDNAEESGQGTLLRQSSPSSVATTACYMFEKNETLVVMSEQNGLTTEERLWFASDKLRLRTSMLKRPDAFDTTSFFSEIRVGDA